MSIIAGNSTRPSYRGSLWNWDERATVRVHPRRVLSAEEADGKLYFAPEMVPATQHPRVAALGPGVVRRLFINHLYRYLDFTAHLEHDVVNSVASCIALGKTGFDLPPDIMHDAYKLYCDEAYHALFSADLRRQVEAATQITAGQPTLPRALRVLHDIEQRSPPELRVVARLFFVIVSETLISSTLVQIPRDDRIITAVRNMIADHAEDEARHHAYFAALLDVLWPRMTTKQRAFVGPLLPRFILAFLEPDFASIKDGLVSCGLGQEEAAQVVEESYPRQQLIAGVRSMAKATIRLCERNGILEDSRTVEGFQQAGLIA